MLLVALSVSGKECRNLKTVAASAKSVTANTAEGGHIWQHVHGLTSRPKGAQKSETQQDKTLFASENDFKKAWNKFQTKKSFGIGYQPQQCKGSTKGQHADCVRATDVNVNQAYRCTVTDKTTKLCTKYDKTKAKYVEFWYAKKGGKWVLNTAYPSGSTTSNAACKKLAKYESEVRRSKFFEALLLKVLKF